MSERVAVVGLGYVGLPVAVAFAKHFPDTVGFDIADARVQALRKGHDSTGEISPEALAASALRFSNDPTDLQDRTFIIVAVPTPIDVDRRPDLAPLLAATRTVGAALSKGAVVVYESTVYPGVTEELCGPLLEECSGLKRSIDFTLGYSPERINPGDKEHTFERIVKVVSGEDDATLERVANTYGTVVQAGVHRAATIKVAEAAKVIENTQRDLNIALMNELALIFDRLDIRTQDVLDAAGTKWNFLRFQPGLVGGHCIGVDPYYLTAKAEAVGYHPEVILAGRRINDGMGRYVAGKTIKLLSAQGTELLSSRVAILGLTFKENVPDLRNSRVPDILKELRQFGVTPIVHDPLAEPEEAERIYGISLEAWDDVRDLDAVILAVPHQTYLADLPGIFARLRQDCVIIDVKSVIPPSQRPTAALYWSL